MKSNFIRQSLVTASILTILISIVSKIFGYFREAAIANYFGTSTVFDLFIIAFTIPEIIITIAFSALPSSLIPALRGNHAGKNGDDADFFWTGSVAFGLIFGCLSVLVFFFRRNVILWFSPDISSSELALGARMVAVLSSIIFFRGMESYYKSWLFEKKHFIVPAASSVLVDILILAAIFMFYASLGVESLAYGWLLSSIAIFIVSGYFAVVVVKPKWKINLGNPGIKSLLKAAIIISIVECISLFYPIIDRQLAAKYLGTGQISALRYASILIQIPVMIIVVAFNLVSFPWISDFSVPGSLDRLKNLYTESIRLFIFVMGLIAVGVAIYSQEIIMLAFQRGAFDSYSLNLTQGPLFYYAVGIVFYSVYIFQMRFYFARPALLRLAIMLIIMLAFKTITSLILVAPLQQNGLAISTSATWVLGFIMMTNDLGRTLKLPFRDLIGPSVWKALILIAFVTAYWLALDRLWPLEDSAFHILIKLMIVAASGIALYITMAVALKLPEAKRLSTSVFARMRLFSEKPE